MAGLPGEYAEPGGVIVLAFDEGADGAPTGAPEGGPPRAAGCVALRPLEEPGLCEMKRMYVRPAWRGRGLGRALGERILDEARARGYRAMRLDTIDTMTPAITLYRDLGFAPIAAYRFNPIPGALYFEAGL